ncbi:hypothetical protein TAO_0083 [Candidatus Nitrosoglobus terrae]|uniref:Transcriptional regulator n=1 Tax=Candidatus Nitrosoglobus terrae TaxID=1630141 RepID=A0A1Q2SK10_9GAMM|nr:metal-sensing transcriptional repressor [Candidatus Nitrosoglobus terrae]BAW79453.1 hypothetical protein TAO_0083 [Candidatus Nitrosoglobus terrae]
MSHTVQGKAKLLACVRRIRNQVEAIERALDAEQGCAEVAASDCRRRWYCTEPDGQSH